jgi:hypothetical protein
MSFTAASDTEYLYPGESPGAEGLKITRIARYVREMRFKNPQAHIAVRGLLSTKILMFTTPAMEKERFTVKDMVWRAANKLSQCQLTDDAVRAYVPYQCVPIVRPGMVALFARKEAPPRAGPYMWDHQPKVQTAVNPEVEASFNMVYDYKAHEEDEKNIEKLKSMVVCEIEVAIWDSKTRNRRILFLPEAKATLKVGPAGIEEVGTELTALMVRVKGEIKGKYNKFDVFENVVVSIKGEAGFEFKREFEGNRLRNMFGVWQAEAKLSLAGILQIPYTSLKLPIEVEPYVDHEGHAGVEFKVKILDW